MAKPTGKKDGSANEVDAYLPLLKTPIPGKARLFPKKEVADSDFSQLLDEPRVVFDPKQLALDDWQT